MVDLGAGGQIAIAAANIERIVDLFFCVKIHSNKKSTSKQKIAWTLRTNNSSLSESYLAVPPNPNSLVGQIQSYPSKIENILTCVYI